MAQVQTIENSDQLIQNNLYNVSVKDGKYFNNAKFHFCKKEDEDGPCLAIFEDENRGEFYLDTEFIGRSYFITPVEIN